MRIPEINYMIFYSKYIILSNYDTAATGATCTRSNVPVNSPVPDAGWPVMPILANTYRAIVNYE